MSEFAEESNVSVKEEELADSEKNQKNGNTGDNEMANDDNSKTEDEFETNDLNDSNDKTIANLSKANDDEDRKLFIGGLNWETEEKDLREYFTKYGSVVDVSIKYDAVSGNPRGFGFITFAAEEAIEEVLKSGPHVICGKSIDPKRAKSRPICKKIFVGGIDSNMTEDEIKKYFQKFGSVEGIELPFDRQRNRRREFCFIIFDTEEAAELAVKEAKQTIGTKECDIKKAQPQPVAQQQKRLQQQNYSYDNTGSGGQRRGAGAGGGRRNQSDSYQSQGNWAGYNGTVAQNYYGNYYGNQYPNAYGYPNQNYDYYSQYGYSYPDYWNYYGYGDTTGAVAGDYSQTAVDTTATYGTAAQPTSQSSTHSHSHHSASTGSASAGKVLRKSGSSASNYHPYRSSTQH